MNCERYRGDCRLGWIIEDGWIDRYTEYFPSVLDMGHLMRQTIPNQREMYHWDGVGGRGGWGGDHRGLVGSSIANGIAVIVNWGGDWGDDREICRWLVDGGQRRGNSIGN